MFSQLKEKTIISKKNINLIYEFFNTDNVKLPISVKKSKTKSFLFN